MTFVHVDCEECGSPEISLDFDCELCGKAVCESCYNRTFATCRQCGHLVCSSCMTTEGICVDCYNYDE